jgi:hypothetical protein
MNVFVTYFDSYLGALATFWQTYEKFDFQFTLGAKRLIFPFCQHCVVVSETQIETSHVFLYFFQVQKARQLLTMEADQAAQIDGFSRPMVPDEPKASRPGPRLWEMPSSQPMNSQDRPQPRVEDEELVDLGDMDTSQIDDKEINQTLEDLTLEVSWYKLQRLIDLTLEASWYKLQTSFSLLQDKDDHGRREMKEEKGGFAEVHGTSTIHEHTSLKMKAFPAITEIPDSAEYSSVEEKSCDDSIHPGDSPDVPIAIVDSDEDDLPTIPRQKSRNKIRRISSDSENEDLRSPVKVIGAGPDIEMASPTPSDRLESRDVQMNSPAIENRQLALQDMEMSSPAAGFPARKIADNDVEMNSPIVAQGKKKTQIIDSGDEDMDMASPIPNQTRRSEMSESVHRASLSFSSNTSKSNLQPAESGTDDSPVKTVSKSSTRRRVIASDSEEELPDLAGNSLSVDETEAAATNAEISENSGIESEELDQSETQLGGAVSPPGDQGKLVDDLASSSGLLTHGTESPGGGNSEGDSRASLGAESGVGEHEESIDTAEYTDSDRDVSESLESTEGNAPRQLIFNTQCQIADGSVE